MSPDEHDYFGSNLSDRHKIEEIFSKRCVLYFPASRFEEPAWLNEEFYFGRVDFEEGLFVEEIPVSKVEAKYKDVPNLYRQAQFSRLL